MTETFYKKVQRRNRVRYEPVLQHETFGALPEGFYMVRVKPGKTSVRQRIYPATDEVEAALRIAEDAMLDALREADKLIPRNTPITPAQQKAWRKFEKAMGDGMYALERASLQEIVEAGMRSLANYVGKTEEWDGANSVITYPLSAV